MERAIFYRELRGLGKLSKQQYEARIHQYEKANAKKIDAFSYLNPNGKTAELMESFEMNGDTNGDFRKVAYRIGIARKKESLLTNLHENELLDWLFMKGNYGTQEGQFFRFDDFREFLHGHLQVLKDKDDLSDDKSLNLENARSISFAMQAYIKILRELRVKKIEINKMFNDKIRNISLQIIDGKKKADLFSSADEIQNIFETPLTYKHAFVALEEKLKELVSEVQNEGDVHRVHTQMTQLLTGITMKIQEHKKDRHKYVAAGATEK